MYRPQFPYSTPANCHDEPFEHYFDTSTMQQVTINALSQYFGLIFQLDRDAEFRWRGWKMGLQNSDVPIEVQWKDAFGNVLSDVISNVVTDTPTVNTALYGVGAGISAGFQGGMCVPWDEEIVCPPGATIEANFFRPYNTSLTLPVLVTLYGVKRYYDNWRMA